MSDTIIYLNNVKEMKLSKELVDGNLVQTKNFYDFDGNGEIFRIVKDQMNEYIVDNINIISIQNDLKAIKTSNFYNFIKPYPNDYLKKDYSFILAFNKAFKLQSYLMHNSSEFFLLSDNAIQNNNSFADPTICYFNNKFFVAYDRTVDEDLPNDIPSGMWYGSNSIMIRSSSNLVKWSSEFRVPVPKNMWQAFAPKFIEVNEVVYMFFSGIENYDVDSTGKNFAFKTYVTHSLNEELSEWSDPTKISFNDNTESQMDVGIIYNENDNLYYLFLKDETTKVIKEYTSNTLNNFSYIKTVVTSREAPEVIKMNGTYFLYCEDFNKNIQYVSSSDDLINWSTFERVNIFYDTTDAKHLGILVINNEKLHNFFDNYIVKFPNFEINPQIYELSKSNYPIYDYKILNQTTYDNLILERNCIYYTLISDVTINSINIDNLRNGDIIGFYVGSDQKFPKIKIHTGNNIFASESIIEISKNNRNNDQLILFYKRSNFLLPISNSNYKMILDTIRKQKKYNSNINLKMPNIQANTDYTITETIMLPTLYDHNLYKITIDIGDAGVNTVDMFYVSIYNTETPKAEILGMGQTSIGVTPLKSKSVSLEGDQLAITIQSTTNARIRWNTELITTSNIEGIN